MRTSIHHTNKLRSISAIFSPSTIRRVIETEDFEPFLERVKKHNDISQHLTVRALLNAYYRRLQVDYRNEYVFKNALLNQELLAKHCLSSTRVLNEFRVGTSLADFVLLNGEIRIFEIKTDLDTFEKLDRQLGEYRKFAERVNVVVSEKNARRALLRYSGSPVGIISYTKKNLLVPIQPARSDISQLDSSVIFKTLRKPEYLGLIEKQFGYVPDVPNTQIFQKCLDLAKSIPSVELQREVRKILKKRFIKSPDLLVSRKTPIALKHICYALDLSRNEYLRLFDFLDIVP